MHFRFTLLADKTSHNNGVGAACGVCAWVWYKHQASSCAANVASNFVCLPQWVFIWGGGASEIAQTQILIPIRLLSI